jgi:WD40 repeat protein
VTGTAHGNIGVYDASTLQKLRTLSGQTGTIRRVAFSPDGQLIASGGDDNSALLWSADTGQAYFSFRANGPVVALAFNSDGRTLIVSAVDGGIYLVDTATGRVIRYIAPTP